MLICSVSLLFGTTILSAGQLHIRPTVRLGIAPLVSLAVWSLALSFTKVVGLPVRDGSLLLWVATIVVCAIGLGIGVHKQLTPTWSLGLCFLIPMAVLAPAFLHGLADYQVSAAPDGWAYVSVAQYMWEFPSTGPSGSGAPLYQFAMPENGSR